MKPQHTMFDKVDVLVHPFFAAENARASGKALSVKKTAPKEILEAYDQIGLVTNWTSRLFEAKLDENKIIILIGPQSLEYSKNQRFHFLGGLSKQKLETFTKEYQNFLHLAKAILGKRLIYITHTIQGNENRIWSLLWQRGLMPARRLKAEIYGEYLGREGGEKQCVDKEADAAEWFLGRAQRAVFGERNTKLEIQKVVTQAGLEKRRHLSLQPDKLAATIIAMQVRKKGKVTPAYLKKKFSWEDPRVTKEIAHTFNSIWKQKPVRVKK